MFEPLLRANAAKFNCTQRYGVNVIHYEEYSDGVIVIVQDTTSKLCKKYKTQYLVACDGNRSPTRRKEKIEWKGAGILRNSLSIKFQADLTPFLGSRAVHGVVYVVNDNISGGFRLENKGKSGIVMVNSTKEKKDFPPGSVSLEEARRYAYECAGLTEETPIEIKSVAYWTMASYNAEKFVSPGGRVLLAGDAVHVMPPTGGLGGNTGINVRKMVSRRDNWLTETGSHNLSWKLAYVLKGWAAPSLLSTYSIERQPIDEFVVDQATRRFHNRVDHRQPPLPEAPDLSVEIGCRYTQGAFIPTEGQASNLPFEDPFTPTGSGGSRFPHIYLDRAGDANAQIEQQISTLDLIKQNFVLVATEKGSAWIQAARELQFALDACELHEDWQPYRDTSAKLRKNCKMENGQALLVQPDGFIAWRAIRVEAGQRRCFKVFWRKY